ncbi:hypothetical protein PG999_007592 [Apiospora kogelbergensis]|uniref:AAA+ ATPase domain-containing protein n=1 Tax=Apiospora kogelbergensis TaxID=1337665 RepID=A0AAW0QLW2_9PEZI
MSNTSTSDPGGTSESAVRRGSSEPSSRTPPKPPPKPPRLKGLPSACSAPSSAANSFVGAAPPFPVPDGLLMSNKKPDEVSVRRFNDLLRRIEPPMIDHLFKWTIKKPQHNPTAIRLVMLGRSEADAKMHMVVFCEERVRRRAKRFFSSTLALELCKPQGAPEHAIEVLIVDAPIPVARVVAQLPAKYICLSSHNVCSCGAPMWFFNPETSAARQVTLGGILQVTRDKGSELFGMTVGHAIEELENPRPQTTQQAEHEDQHQQDSQSEVSSDSRDHNSNNGQEAAPSSAEGDLIRPLPNFRPHRQQREDPWKSSSMMLTALKAIPGSKSGAYLDWALACFEDSAPTSGVFNLPKKTEVRARSLKIPPNRDFDKQEDFPITLMSSEGPKPGSISFLPSRFVLSPGRSFVDTYMIQLHQPHVITHGDSGSWVMNENSGLIYGHLVATDIFGGGYVVPFLDAIDDIKERLGASSVMLPGSINTRAWITDFVPVPGPKPQRSQRHTISPKRRRNSDGFNSMSSGSEADNLRPPIKTIIRDRKGKTVFEMAFATRPREQENPQKKPDLKIFSRSLVYALQSVVRYYPRSVLGMRFPEFSWPYQELVHHYDDLKNYVAKLTLLDCRAKRSIHEHTELLIDFLDVEAMPEIREELERNRRGMFTFDLAWVSQKPGTTIIWNEGLPSIPRKCPPETDFINNRGPCVVPGPPHANDTAPSDDMEGRGPFVVMFLRITEGSNAPLYFSGWRLEYNGRSFGRVVYSMAVQRFVGERPMRWRVVKPELWTEGNIPPDVANLIRKGKMYWSLNQRAQCWQYTSSSPEPSRAINSLVMVDCQEAMKKFPYEAQAFMDDSDMVHWSVSCPEPQCTAHEVNENPPEFADYLSGLETKEAVTNHQCLLFPSTIRGFVLTSQSWEQLNVDNFTIPTWNDTLVDALIMDVLIKERIICFFEAHSRGRKSQLLSPKGKGNGLAIILHGNSGLGKTFTAESMAAHAREPLLTLSPREDFAGRKEPEQHFREIMRLANLWRLIVHITDAHLLCEPASGEPEWWQARFRGGKLTLTSTTPSASANVLTAFHNALDTNQGLVILETRQIDNFSDDIISRVHAQVYYSQFSPNELTKIWDNLLAEFKALGIGFSNDARDFITRYNIKHSGWNGNKMRRVIESAIAMAKSDEWTKDYGEGHKSELFVDILDLEDAAELSVGV